MRLFKSLYLCRFVKASQSCTLYSCWKIRSISNKNHSPNSRMEYIYSKKSTWNGYNEKRITKREWLINSNRKIEMIWNESFADDGPYDKLGSFGCLHSESLIWFYHCWCSFCHRDSLTISNELCTVFHFKCIIDKGRHKVISTLNFKLFIPLSFSRLSCISVIILVYHTHTMALALQNIYSCWLSRVIHIVYVWPEKRNVYQFIDFVWNILIETLRK